MIISRMEQPSNEECSNKTIEDGEHRGQVSSGKISFACMTLNTFGSKKAKKVLPSDFEPNEYTVILGRGACADSDGNRKLKLLVQTYLQQYLDAPDKLGKSLIVTRVLEVVREASPRAAFVKYEKGHWVDVGERTSREKGKLLGCLPRLWLLCEHLLTRLFAILSLLVGSMFRDCLGDKYKSSAKNKTAIRAQKKLAKQHDKRA